MFEVRNKLKWSLKTYMCVCVVGGRVCAGGDFLVKQRGNLAKKETTELDVDDEDKGERNVAGPGLN